MFKIKKMKLLLITILVTSAPGIIFAAGTFSDLTKTILKSGLYKSLITLLFTGAVIVFLWGIALFIFSADDSSKIAEGKKKMLWGIIALFVMFSLSGLITILDKTFNLENSSMHTYPQFTH